MRGMSVFLLNSLDTVFCFFHNHFSLNSSRYVLHINILFSCAKERRQNNGGSAEIFPQLIIKRFTLLVYIQKTFFNLATDNLEILIVQHLGKLFLDQICVICDWKSPSVTDSVILSSVVWTFLSPIELF